MKPISFITGNTRKFNEARTVFPDLIRLDIDLPELQESDPVKILKHKLAVASAHGVRPVIVDDTGLYFESLNGLPGPLVKWFLDRIGSSGLADLASRLESTRATARTYLGMLCEDGEELFAEGCISGTIVSPRGVESGWNSIFLPDGSEKTFGELTDEERTAISMRRIAFENLKSRLRS